MTNANAEAQRRWRQRQQEKKKASLKEAEVVTGAFQTPFCDHFADDWFGSDFDVALGLAGLETPKFDDDRGPASFIRDDLPEGETFPDNAPNSLGRAEVIIGLLITAAADLAQHVNGYKRFEIKQRHQEIEERDLSDPQVRKAAIQEATRLNKMLDQLDKQVRWTFPQWKVTG